MKKEFFDLIEKSDGCWNFIGKNKNRKGYGSFCVNGKAMGAHRYSYLIHRGEIKRGNYILHRCDNPSCVNPNHLFQGTQRDNIRDMIEKRRGVFQKNGGGESHPLHKLTYAQILQIKGMRSLNLNQKIIAGMFGVHQCNISRILSDKRWQKYEPLESR